MENSIRASSKNILLRIEQAHNSSASILTKKRKASKND